MTLVERIADFALRAAFEALSSRARKQIKIRILDALGCALGALAREPIQRIRKFLNDLDGAGSCALIGSSTTSA